MSMMYDYYKDLLDPTEMYENWQKDMYEIAQRDPEEKKILLQLFENEQNEEVKSWLARVLIDLKEDCVFPYLLDVLELDKDLSQKKWAAINLIKLNFALVKGVLVGLFRKNAIDKTDFAIILTNLNTPLSKDILNELQTFDPTIQKDIEFLDNRIKRQKAFSKTWFSSKAEQIYEGVNCGALEGPAYFALSTLASESAEEREIVFSILTKEPDLHQSYLLATELLKVDFERALGHLLHLVEDTEYSFSKLALFLMKLNHPFAVKAFKKVYSRSSYIYELLEIETPIAKKILSSLLEEYPEMVPEYHRLKEINERCKKLYGANE